MKKIRYSILYEKIDEISPESVYVPVKLLVGYENKKKSIFLDLADQEPYPNFVNNYPNVKEHFYKCSTSIKELKELYGDLPEHELLMLYITKEMQFIYTNLYSTENKIIFDKVKRSFLKENYDYELYCPIELISDIDKDCEEFFDIETELRQEEETAINVQTQKETKKTETKLPKISKTISDVEETVVSQSDAVKQITTAVYKNILIKEPKLKSNVLLYGPSGVGKTLIAETLGKKLDKPVLTVDMTSFTSAGYKGNDVERILVQLYELANNDLEKAEQGIIILDEIDKKADRGSEQSSFQRSDVLKSLLKMIEGGKFEVETGYNSYKTFDTKNITFICCGAFTDLTAVNETSRPIGFGEQKIENNETEISTDQFVKYGMPLEFMGRMDCIVGLNPLKKEDLVSILKQSNLSPIKTYINGINNLGIKVEFPERLYEIVAEEAIKRKTGARGLKSIVNELFGDIIYEVLDKQDNIESVKLEENKKYTLKHK